MSPASFALTVALLAGAQPGASPARPAPLRVEVDAEGAPVVFREGDPAPLRGVDIYRAVLRLDLVERHERARMHRRALVVGGSLAVVAGPALGWAFGKAAARPTVNCWILGDDGQPIPKCRPNEDIERENSRKVRRGLLAGTSAGAALAAVLFTAGLAIHPQVPDVADARALVERYNARLGPPPGARLRIEPLEGGGWVGIGGSF